jgi:biopolymer transport protein ExbB/TolQ
VAFIVALVGGVVVWHALGAAIVVLLFVSIAVIDMWWKKRAATKLKLAHEARTAQITQDRHVAEARHAAAIQQRRAEREAAIAKREAASQAFADLMATLAAQRRTKAERQPPAP